MLSSPGKCFKVFRWTDRMNFKNAMEKCQSLNATLAEPKNEGENKALATGFNIQARFWLGISDRDIKGTFKYVSDGSKVEYTSWSKNTQNKWPKQDCVASKNGKWDTINCVTRKLPFICQMDINGCGEDDYQCKFDELMAKLEVKVTTRGFQTD